MANTFGSYPLQISRNEDGTYQVAPQNVETAAACAILATFTADLLPVMQARAAAHGFLLEEPTVLGEAEDAVSAFEATISQIRKAG